MGVGHEGGGRKVGGKTALSMSSQMEEDNSAIVQGGLRVCRWEDVRRGKDMWEGLAGL